VSRRAGTLLATGLAALLLTGCGGDDTEAYCDALGDAQEAFTGAADPAVVGAMASQVDELTELAPDEVEDEWVTLRDALGEFESALQDAGLGFDDLDDAEALAGMAPEAVATLQEVATRMGTALTEATDGIEAHAEETCGLQLG
jgi:hypothetical protein